MTRLGGAGETSFVSAEMEKREGLEHTEPLA